MKEVCTEIAGTVWKRIAEVGSRVQQGDRLLILESMKMEIPLESPVSGTLSAWLVEEKDMVQEDQPVARIETD